MNTAEDLIRTHGMFKVQFRIFHDFVFVYEGQVGGTLIVVECGGDPDQIGRMVVVPYPVNIESLKGIRRFSVYKNGVNYHSEPESPPFP